MRKFWRTKHEPASRIGGLLWQDSCRFEPWIRLDVPSLQCPQKNEGKRDKDCYNFPNDKLSTETGTVQCARLTQVSDASNKDYLLSFPHSGNHWVRFILEFFSGMPTAGYGEQDIPIHRNLFSAVVNPLWHVRNEGLPFLYKSHGVSLREKEELRSNCNSVLLLIRNYYETRGIHYIMSKTRIKEVEKDIRYYLSILLEYEQVKVSKMHVHYKDLILQPRETIASILAFYDIDNPEMFEYFMRNYKKMQSLSRSAVRRDWRRSTSENDLSYHRRRHHEKLPELDKLFQQIYSEPCYDCIRHLMETKYTINRHLELETPPASAARNRE